MLRSAPLAPNPTTGRLGGGKTRLLRTALVGEHRRLGASIRRGVLVLQRTWWATSLLRYATSVLPLNSNFTLPNPENHNSSSASRSKVPAVSSENDCTFAKGRDV